MKAGRKDSREQSVTRSAPHGETVAACDCGTHLARADERSRAFEAQPPYGFGELCVLLVLRRGPAHGYGIVREFTGCGLALGRGAVYGALRRIERQSLAVSYLAASAGGPAQKCYRLTVAGQAAAGEAAVHADLLIAAVNCLLDEEDRARGSAPSRPGP